jgi:outer membrane protein
MKKVFEILSVLSFLGVVIAIWLGVKQEQQNRLAYVNVNKLMLEYHAMEEAIEKYKDQNAKYRHSLDTLATSIQEDIAKFEQSRKQLSNAQIKQREKNLQLRQFQLEKYQHAIDAKMNEHDSELTEKIIREISEKIREYGRDHGYQIIMGAGNGTIIYAEHGLDITEDVLKYLND